MNTVIIFIFLWMKQMKSKQKGFGLLGIMITMGFVSAIFLSMAEGLVVKQIRAQAKPFEKRMLYIREQIDAYQLNRYQDNANNFNSHALFPRTLADLSPDYIPTCSVTDNQKGSCELIDQLPWGDGSQKIQYQVKRTTGITPAHYYAEITLPLPSKSDESSIREYNVYSEVLAKLPGMMFSTDEQLLVWRINRLGNMPAFELMLDGYVKKDGSTRLTKDWDVGNKALLNVSDITLRNSDGTLTSVAAGLTRKAFIARHGDFIAHPSCPKLMTPKIKLAALGNIPTQTANDFENFGPMRIMPSEYHRQWQIIAEYIATRKSDHRRVTLRDGIVSGETYCSK